MTVPFIDNLGSDHGTDQSHHHSHDVVSHDHGGDHGHTHEHLDHPGKFAERDLPDYSNRNFHERGFTVGIGGYVCRSFSFRGPPTHPPHPQ